MKLAPSLLSADFGRLCEEVEEVAGLVDLLHIDVMDGHFVPNITIGPVVVNSLRRGLKTRIPFDIHLMITNPGDYIERFIVNEGDIITFHIEAARDPFAVIKKIRKAGAGVGVSLKPKTPLEAIKSVLGRINLVLVMAVEPGFGGQKVLPATLPKLRSLKKMTSNDVEIGVDGGICGENIKEVLKSGAEMIVAGSAIFGQKNRKEAIEELKRAAIS
jgi:ribulose-phosphate 3-epimerase